MCVAGKDDTTQGFIHRLKGRTRLTMDEKLIVLEIVLRFLDLISEGKYVGICQCDLTCRIIITFCKVVINKLVFFLLFFMLKEW